MSDGTTSGTTSLNPSATEPCTRIILVRHGHVEGIAPPRFRGQTDLPLTDRGIQQVDMTGKWLAKGARPDAIYASPLSRCVRTADAIAKQFGASVSAIEAFTDIDFGTWQGRTFDDVQAADPEGFACWRKTPHWTVIPNGENLYAVAARVLATSNMILDRHHGGTAILVGHDSVNRVLLLLALDLPLSRFWRLRQDPCGISVLDYDNANGWTVQSINETMHLAGE